MTITVIRHKKNAYVVCLEMVLVGDGFPVDTDSTVGVKSASKGMGTIIRSSPRVDNSTKSEVTVQTDSYSGVSETFLDLNSLGGAFLHEVAVYYPTVSYDTV